MHTLIRAVGLALILAAFGNPSAVSAQASDPGIGTWNLNITKSKYSPGPPPKSVTLRVEASAQGRKVATDGVAATGNPTHTEYTASFDGKDYPIKGDPDLDTIALKRIDQYSYERTGKRAGKVVQTITAVASRDGKTLTITSKGTNAQGQTYNNVLVYEKK